MRCAIRTFYVGSSPRLFRESAEAYRVALELDDRSEPARVKLASALFEIGDRPQALAEVQKVLTRNPDSAEGKKLSERMSKSGN